MVTERGSIKPSKMNLTPLPSERSNMRAKKAGIQIGAEWLGKPLEAHLQKNLTLDEEGVSIKNRN